MKKWTKVLSAFVVATVMSAGMAAVAGCDGCGGDEHKHTYGTDWKGVEAGHYHESTCGHADSKLEPHVDNTINATGAEGQDGICDLCNWVMVVPVGKVQVIFNSNGGSAVTTATVDKGATVSKPTDPTRTNYDFGGWFTDNGTFQNEFDFTKAVNENVTVYAKWTLKDVNVTVTFDVAGGSAVDAQVFKAGNKATEPTAPTRGGYIFEGWFTAASGGIKFDFDKEIVEDTTVYAHWRVKSIYDDYSVREDVVFTETFEATTSLDVHGGMYGNKGVYVINQKGGNDISGAYAISGEALELGRAAKDPDNNAFAVVDFGIIDGAVEGYFKINIKKESSSGTFNTVTFRNQSGDEVLKIEAIGGGKFTYTIKGSAAVATDITSVANKDYEFEFKFENKKATVKINGTAILTEADITNDVFGYTIMTSDGGARKVAIDDIIVCGTEVSHEAYKADLVSKLESKLANMTEGDDATHKINKDDVIAACDKDSVTAATDNAAAYTAYRAAVDAMNAITADVQITAMATIETKFPAANYTQNKAAYDKQLDIIRAEFNADMLVEGDGTTLSKVLAALEALDDDATVYAAYFIKANADFVAEVHPENYTLNSEFATTMEEISGEYELGDGKLGDKTYAQAVKDLNDAIDAMKEAIAGLDNNTKIVNAYVAEQLADLATYGDDDMDDMEVSADTRAVVASIRTAAGNKLNAAAITAILAAEGFDDDSSPKYYQTVIDKIITDAKSDIDDAILEDGMTIEERRDGAKADFATYYAEQLEDIVEPNDDMLAIAIQEIVSDADHKLNTDLATALAAATDAKGVKDALLEAEAAFDTWLTNYLASYEYDVTLHLANGNTVAAKVKYGTVLAGFDPTDGINNVMLNPENTTAYEDENCSTPYAGPKAYAELHYSVVLAKIVEASSVSFDYAAITGKTADQEKLTQADFDGTVNSFITIVNTDVTYRSKTINSKAADCIEVKDGGLQVTFDKPGTLAISFSSTGSSNASRLGLKLGDTWIAGTTTATLVKDGDEAGSYETSGTGAVTVTFTVTEAGTYTITCPSAALGRGARIFTIVKTIAAHKVEAGEEDIVHVTGAELTAAEDVQVGKSVKLNLTVTPGDAGYTASWSSDNDKVKVDSNGNVTCDADATVGSTATITVVVTDTMDPSITFTKTCTVTVIAEITAVTYTYTAGGTNAEAWDASAAGSNTSGDVKGTKIEPTKALKLNASGTMITVEMNGFTTASSSAMTVTINLKDADGNIVGTLNGTTPTGKAVGDFTFENGGKVTATAKFTSIEIICGTSGKHLSVATAKIIVE